MSLSSFTLLASSLVCSIAIGIFFWLWAPPAHAEGYVLINEIVTDPMNDWSTNGFSGEAGEGSITTTDEYIELYNPTSQAIDLTGWTLEMTDTTPVTQTLAGSIAPNGYVVIGNPNGAINNDLRLVLRDASGTIQDMVSLGTYNDGNTEDNAPSGNATDGDNEAVQRNNTSADTNTDLADFHQGVASPGARNTNPAPITPPTPAPEQPTEPPKDSPAPEKPVAPTYTTKTFAGAPEELTVRITGTVTAPPGLLFKDYGYLQDVFGAIRFRLSVPAKLAIGDTVLLEGKVGDAHTVHYARIVKKHKGTSTVPQQRTTKDLSEKYIGTLALFSGTIAAQNGQAVTLTEGVRVVLPKQLQKPDWKKGQPIRVAGILDHTSVGWRILVRMASDLTLATPTPSNTANTQKPTTTLPTTGSPLWPLLVAGTLAPLGLFWRLLAKNKE